SGGEGRASRGDRTGGVVGRKADPIYFSALLRARRERPRRRAANKRDELAPPHSIASSASCPSCKGTSRPSALAVFMLMTSRYLVGACTGRSPGFDPFRIRST